MNDRIRKIVKERLLAAIDDLRRQAEAGEIHTLAYAATTADGHTVISALTNGSIKPVTLLGAVQLLSARLVEAASGLETAEYRTYATDGPPSDLN